MPKPLLLAIALLLLAACRPVAAPIAATTATAQAPEAKAKATAATAQVQAPAPIEPQGFTRNIHDPVMAKDGNTYYVFSTGTRIPFICSHDMVNWEFCGRVFDRIPDWITSAIPSVGDLWAPDISYFDGKWRLYYAASTFGSRNSAIGLATNKTLDPNSPDYKWVDEGEVLRSTEADNWNAIDPNFVIDAGGQPWLALGSFWSGLKLRKLNPATGKLANDGTTLYSLADRRTGPDKTDAIEGAFIIRHGDYYYLFASFDKCCQGAASTYNVRVGRSTNITGPYLDRDGKSMLEGGGTKILAAYDHWRGPGHNGIFSENGTDWIVYHAYDAQLNGISFLRLEPLTWDAAGWPHVPSNPDL